jgi:hypothetical protein
MTIAVVVKVQEGIVLATDSATPLIDASGRQTVYFSAKRILNLHPELPIALMSWGIGNVGATSVTQLAREVRERFVSGEPGWRLDPASYQLSTVAERVREFVFDERIEELRSEGVALPDLGLCVAGYSANERLPEFWEVLIEKDSCGAAKLIGGTETTGITWYGQSESIRRVVLGVSNTLRPALLAANVHAGEISKIVRSVKDHSEELIAPPAMPIREAVDLAEWLIQTAVQYDRFASNTDTSGGPTRIATITRHDGFEWATSDETPSTRPSS